MSAAKNEKQVIDEKVAKVREVVHNVSRNDIVLALHNFELDVERTINAFCAGGAESALGDWEKTGTAGKKKQQKKKKGAETSTVSSASSNTNLFAVKSTPPPARAPPASSPSTASLSSLNGSINGYSAATPAATAKPQQNGVSTKTSAKTAPTKNGTSHAAPKAAKEPAPPASKAVDVPITAHGLAETAISQCFQELRRALADRERQLLSEVAHGGSEARFAADAAKLLQAIARFGEVESTKPNAFSPQPAQATANSINHSTSHSSLVSSVGEDSGVGQTSPVAREKSTSQVVSNGGIVMQSDALSEEQLADLQRRIEETLKAQGIDPSVLSDIGSGGAARRRPPPKKPQRKEQRPDKGRNQPQVELSILQ